jgi:hypothetical protein
MKKKIQSELRTIAKRILDSDESLDTESIRSLTVQLYERVLVLSYLEKQPKRNEVTPVKAPISSSLDSKSYREQNWFNDPEPVPQPTYSEEIAEPLIEKIKDIVAQIPKESQKVDDLLNELLPKMKNSKNELEDFASHYRETPVFERKDLVEKEFEILKEQNSLSEYKDQVLNMGLIDRTDFLKHLFDNDQEDFSRILSQIDSMSSFEEAETFISNHVKPEYNNWENRNEYEKRFMIFFKKRFNSSKI